MDEDIVIFFLTKLEFSLLLCQGQIRLLKVNLSCDLSKSMLLQDQALDYQQNIWLFLETRIYPIPSFFKIRIDSASNIQNLVCLQILHLVKFT